MGIGGVERGRTVDIALLVKRLPLISVCTGRDLCTDIPIRRRSADPRWRALCQRDFQAITGGADFALIVRVFARMVLSESGFPSFASSFSSSSRPTPDPAVYCW